MASIRFFPESKEIDQVYLGFTNMRTAARSCSSLSFVASTASWAVGQMSAVVRLLNKWKNKGNSTDVTHKVQFTQDCGNSHSCELYLRVSRTAVNDVRRTTTTSSQIRSEKTFSVACCDCWDHVTQLVNLQQHSYQLSLQLAVPVMRAYPRRATSDISPALLVLEDRRGHSVCGVSTWLGEHEWSHQMGVWMASNNPPACAHIRAKGAWNEGGLTVPHVSQHWTWLPAMVILPPVLGNGQMERWRTGMVAKGGAMIADDLDGRHLYYSYKKNKRAASSL